MDEIPTHRLRDNDLLKELTKSNGESPYYEGIENLTDYSQYTKFLNMMGDEKEFDINFSVLYRNKIIHEINCLDYSSFLFRIF